MRELINTITNTSHIALARSFEEVREWCWRNNIDIRNVRYVFDKRDVAGIDGYEVILFDRIDKKYDTALVELIRSRSSAVKSYLDKPVVTNGKIVGWK